MRKHRRVGPSGAPANGSIEPDLSAPIDPRTAVENEIYALLRDEPEVKDAAMRDPLAFVRERFGLKLDGIDLREEAADHVVIVIPHSLSREELDDDMLDLVSGGSTCPATASA